MRLILSWRHRWWLLLAAEESSPSPSPLVITSVYLTYKHSSNGSYSPYFNCASTRAFLIPLEQLRRPSPSVIIVAALDASAFCIMSVGDGQSYMTSYLSCKLLMKWSFIPYIFKRVCALPTLVHSFVRQTQYLITSLAAGGSHMVPVSSYNHTPSASAKQAYPLDRNGSRPIRAA
jgi:hypothetical protein